MLKKIFIVIAAFSITAFALVFQDSDADSLNSEQMQQISDLISSQESGVAIDRVRFGIGSDVRDGEKPRLVSLIKSYIVDSLGLNSNSIMERSFPWTPSLEMPLENVRPGIIEIIPVTNFFQQSLIVLVDTANTEVRGDTISTGKDGFALIRYNNNHRITLHENTELVLSHSNVRLLSGSISVSQSKEIFANHRIIPLRIITENNDFELSGSAFVSVSAGEPSVAQVFDGRAISRTETEAETQSDTILAKPFPDAPVLFRESSFAALPGDLIKFPNTGDFKQRIIVANADREIVMDTIADSDYIYLPLQFGTLQYFARNIDSAGFISSWAQKNISLRKLYGLKSIEIFDDTLFYQTDDRPFTFRGIADTSVELFIDNQAVVIAENGEFSHRVMLKDSLNYPEIIVLYKDLSGDTIAPTIFYTGFDERIEMNDSLMGKPAFTTSRTYNWRGVAPTATSIRINGEEIEIQEGGVFEKTFRLREFNVFPVIIDVVYENGNSQTFIRSLSREKYASSAELKVRELLFAGFATLMVGGMIVLTIIGYSGN